MNKEQLNTLTRRVSSKKWKTTLLHGHENFVVDNILYKMIPKNIGYGVVEVSVVEVGPFTENKK